MNYKYLALNSLLVTCLFAGHQVAHADNSVDREYQFDLGNINEVEIRGGVGSIEIRPGKANSISIELEIEGVARGWFRRTLDISDIELVSKIRGQRLQLEQTEKNTKTTWIIYMPALQKTDIQLGVGEIDADLGATDLDIELGVGAVTVHFPRDAAGPVNLHVGVGDASLKGLASNIESRAFVSHDVSADGEGNYDIDIEVGVGDIDLRLL